MSTTATTRAAIGAARGRRPMNPWRLEWLRMVRTPRALSLVCVYVAFGLLGPVMAKYMAQILEHSESNVTIIVKPPTPADGMANYIGQVSQTGLIVAAVVAAGSLAFDGRRGLSTFLRTRTSSMARLVLPRYVVPTVAAVLAYVLGTLAAWYETALLLGSLPPGAVLAGVLCQTAYLVFAMAVVALAASLARGTLGTVGVALGVLLVMPLVGNLAVLRDWLPSSLVTAPVDLLAGSTLTDYVPALAVALVSTPVLLTAAVLRLQRREV